MRHARAIPGSDGALAPVVEYQGPERLVGFGFRLWLNGFRTGDISNWEKAWSAYASTIGADAARTAVGQLSCWVRTIDCYAQRELETAPNDCARFCRDECVAIAMIAACQHHACPAMRACAFTLLGCSMIDEVVAVAEGFARSMRDADQVLSPASAHTASLLLMAPATGWSHQESYIWGIAVIVCSCLVISDAEIERALVEILSQPEAPLPTPGVVYRQLDKRMVCCGCAPLAVSTIYQKIDELAQRGVVCPYACATAKGRILERVRDSSARRLIESALALCSCREEPATPDAPEVAPAPV